MYSPKLLTKRRLFLWFSTFLQLFNFLASSLSDSSESFVIPPSTKVSLSGWKIKSTVLINQLFFRNLVKLQHVKVISFIQIFLWNYSRKNQHHLFLKISWNCSMHKKRYHSIQKSHKIVEFSDCKIRAQFYFISHFSEISRNCRW